MGTEPRRIVRIGIDILCLRKLILPKTGLFWSGWHRLVPFNYSLNEHLEKVGSFSLVGIVVEFVDSIIQISKRMVFSDRCNRIIG